MPYTVRQVAEQSGVSVRTLHYYDEIGLLPPSSVTESGYRLYDEKALARLQQILLFRELDFPLKDILAIMQHPGYDQNEALERHRKLLQLRRCRLDRLISLVDNLLQGGNTVSFKEFDSTEIMSTQKQYAEEVKTRWGNTPAYEESHKKTSGYDKEAWAGIAAEAQTIWRAFAAHMNEDPGSLAVQKLVADWQAHITKYYYECTNEILAGLGVMYTADERFRQNIDRCGEGLAAFMSRAIQVYTANNTNPQ